ncbi:PREDICTED: uncharacterized protein LOC108757744 isoform X2 [Trachymyrmex cornetzi]|uniref:uncharacterized protein LOC108757744 isoform X2 n=1 Tax=Trachymyrmex cornetzi TaxID=471704 RepID=UPI00084F1C63|nr:PREDICTED: uncharacterized protein LOC108757744 isoform X2 [Trachymyrmex cornetzi]
MYNLTEGALEKTIRADFSKDKHVMYILDIEVLVSGDQVGNKIGNPTKIEMKPEL